MAIRRRQTPSWLERTDTPSRLYESGSSDYELYEEDDEFVLGVELPGFDTDEIDLTWDDGIMNVAAEHVDDKRDERRTYHRRFRFPKTIADDDITASYENGILEVRLPMLTEPTARGMEIEIDG